MSSEQFECKRCGKCCQQGTIWVHSEHLLVRALLKAVNDFRDSGPCDMLAFEGGKAVCLLQKYLGKAAKPEACQDYPFAEDKKLCISKKPFDPEDYPLKSGITV